MPQPMKRRTQGGVDLNHENRIQTLERRIPEEFPQYYALAPAEVSTSVDGTFDFGWTFPDDEPCELPDCDPDQWHTVGDSLLLPTGYRGPFEIWLTASLTSGTTEIENYLEVTAAHTGSDAPTDQIKLFAVVEVFDGEVFDDTVIGHVFEERTEQPPPNTVTSLRVFSLNKIASGLGIGSGGSTFRYAVRPQVAISGIGGAVVVDGLGLTVALLQERTALPQFSA